jgi:hypothetical protein
MRSLTNQQGFDMFVFELWKINSTGDVLEGVWSTATVPSSIEKDDPTYTIYYHFKEDEVCLAGIY